MLSRSENEVKLRNEARIGAGWREDINYVDNNFKFCAFLDPDGDLKNLTSTCVNP